MTETQRLLKAIGLHPEVIQPLGNLMIVRMFQAEATTQGGVLLPDAVLDRDRQALARVISVGRGQRSLHNGEFLGTFCEIGDLIVVLKHAPVEVQIGGETFHTVFEGDVVGIVDQDLLQPFLDEMAEADEAAADARGGEEVVLGDGRVVNIRTTESGLVVAEGVHA